MFVTNLLEHRAADAAPGPSAAARTDTLSHVLAAGLGESPRCPAVRCLDDDVTLDTHGGPTHTDNSVCVCWWHHRYLASSGWNIRMLRGAVQIMAPPWLETGPRTWRNATTSRTQLTDAINRKNVTQDGR